MGEFKFEQLTNYIECCTTTLTKGDLLNYCYILSSLQCKLSSWNGINQTDRDIIALLVQKLRKVFKSRNELWNLCTRRDRTNTKVSRALVVVVCLKGIRLLLPLWSATLEGMPRYRRTSWHPRYYSSPDSSTKGSEILSPPRPQTNNRMHGLLNCTARPCTRHQAVLVLGGAPARTTCLPPSHFWSPPTNREIPCSTTVGKSL